MSIPFRNASAAVVLALAAAPAMAQLVQTTRTMYSPPLNGGTHYACTIVNSTASPVTVTQFRLEGQMGSVPTVSLCGAPPYALQPGGYCQVVLVQNSVPGAPGASVACRVRHHGSEGSLLGAFMGTLGVVSRGVVPLLPITGSPPSDLQTVP